MHHRPHDGSRRVVTIRAVHSSQIIAIVTPAALLAMGVTAQAASGPAIPVGFYAPSLAQVKAGTSATVNLNVIDHGKKVDNIGAQCDTPANATEQGLAPGTQIVVEETGALPVKGRAFSFTGTVTLGPDETGNGSTVTSSLTVNGRFKAAKYVLHKTPAVSGTITAGLCDPATTVTSYTLQWSSKAPAPAATTRHPVG
jgi:hypothetical protein